MHTSTSAPANRSSVAATNRFSWRVVDIVVAAVLGVAIGLLFWGWNTVGGLWFTAMDGLTPGLGGIAVGIWLIGGVIGGLVIRKPGAALLVELIAAIVSALIGNVWGVTTIFSGLAQGLGAELIFLAFLYVRFTLPVAMLAGVGAGVGAWVLELFLTPNIVKSLEFNLIYLGTLAVSGALLAGLVGWLLVRALAATGALSRFAAGREARRDV
ncbi:energy-coupling factor transport system substrate-specific component [Microbacterium testaceum]|uniref:ECF transporter S component n=1 Tax=Microbacterium TaxID=33882 RepID=UPI001AE3148A|nr:MULTISPECIES: ECF transporter S component [Microbacterium]MDQ1112130.1 energy-coupling factor transport system substrate-specific component [Microbacterium testaceum]MDR6097336.1 energy-coupling factor transport system substrate-specific component [Microbacterium sp. SORGH_AS_0454]WAC69950.1 ECF transporter S component [Microbacterium sp. SL75]